MTCSYEAVQPHWDTRIRPGESETAFLHPITIEADVR
jgi:hypothetical protein